MYQVLWYDCTNIVTDNRSFSLQFIIYGSYYAVISVLFLTRGTYTVCLNYHSLSEEKKAKGLTKVIAAERF